MIRKISGILSFVWFLAGCTSGETTVEFDQVLLPQVADIGKLAVMLEGEFEPKVSEDIVAALRKCPLYTDVRVIDKPMAGNPSGTTEEVFAAQLSKYAKASGGLLRIRMEHLENTEDSEKSQSFLLFDQATYDWYPSFGVPRLGTMGFATGMEVAPEVKKRRRTPLVRTNRYQQVYRMSLYNKSKGKMVYDRVGKNISALSVFSSDPAFKKTQFETLVRASLLQDIAFHSCPPIAKVERHIYAASGSSATARAVTEGVNAANAGDWEAAATKWNEVIASDAKNALAHHNIGVYFERNGEVSEALRHYRMGIKDKRIQEDAFGEIVGSFLPQDEPMEASVVQVTGGNWVFVDVPAGEKRTRGSVYRASPIIDPDSSRVIGQTLKEIAVLRFVTSQEQRRAARVREYLLDSPVRVGDLVVFSDIIPIKAP